MSARPRPLLHLRDDRQPKGCSTRTLDDAALRRVRWPDRSASRRRPHLLVVPMFHVNAWGCPTRSSGRGDAAAAGPPPRHRLARGLIEDERATVMPAPTIYAALLRHADEHRPDLSSIRAAICGGAAMPCRSRRRSSSPRRAAAARLGDDRDEPMCTVARALPVSPAMRVADPRHSGEPVPFVDLRLIDDAASRSRGTASRPARSRCADRGSRAPITARMCRKKFDEGWLRTGDIANVDPEVGHDHRPLEGRHQIGGDGSPRWSSRTS